MKTNNSTQEKVTKTNFFKTVLEDKKAMRLHIEKTGSLKGFKSNNFNFAKPL